MAFIINFDERNEEIRFTWDDKDQGTIRVVAENLKKHNILGCGKKGLFFISATNFSSLEDFEAKVLAGVRRISEAEHIVKKNTSGDGVDVARGVVYGARIPAIAVAERKTPAEAAKFWEEYKRQPHLPKVEYCEDLLRKYFESKQAAPLLRY